jgi:hypothetical protein
MELMKALSKISSDFNLYITSILLLCTSFTNYTMIWGCISIYKFQIKIFLMTYVISASSFTLCNTTLYKLTYNILSNSCKLVWNVFLICLVYYYKYCIRIHPCDTYIKCEFILSRKLTTLSPNVLTIERGHTWPTWNTWLGP